MTEVWAVRNANGGVDRFAPDGTPLGAFDLSPSSTGGATGFSIEVVGSEVRIGLSDMSIQRVAFDTTLLGSFGAGTGDAVGIAVVPEPSTALLLVWGLLALSRRTRPA